jgi:hypothetical protein
MILRLFWGPKGGDPGTGPKLQVQPSMRGFEALAKKEPRIAKFFAEASGKK